MAKTNTGHAFAVRMARARAEKAAKRAGHHPPKKRAKAHHAPAHHAPRHTVRKVHERCEHPNPRPVFQGHRAKWCGRCGAIFASGKWHHPSRR